MKKSSLFLSAAITTFILAILAGVVKAQASGIFTPTTAAATNTSPVEQPTAPATVEPTEAATLAPTAAGYVSPEEAIFIASQALGSTDLYSIDTVTQYGMDVYKITFSSGIVVYVSPSGHILSIVPPRRVVVQPTAAPHSSGSNNQSQPSTPSHSSHEGEDDSGDD
jgi:hypothetical protein